MILTYIMIKNLFIKFKKNYLQYYIFAFIVVYICLVLLLSILSLNNVKFSLLIYSYIKNLIDHFNAFNYLPLTNFLSDISMLLLGVTIPIFVFTVTILGNAVKLAKEQKENTEQQNKKEFDEEIVNLNKEISNNLAQKNLLDTLKEKISNIESKKLFTEDKLKKIENKYNTLNLKNSVFVPGSVFILSIFIQKILVPINDNKLWQSIIIIIGMFVLSFGIQKIVTLLSVIQEVSIDDGERKSEELKNSLINALETMEDKKEPKPFLKFKEKAPFILKANTENEIEFRILLREPGGSEAKNINLWILLSPELDVLPIAGYGKSFKQNKSYSIPNANTIIYDDIDIIRTNINCTKKIKIKTTTAGNYKLRYMINCDNHVGTDQDIDIIVQD